MVERQSAVRTRTRNGNANGNGNGNEGGTRTRSRGGNGAPGVASWMKTGEEARKVREREREKAQSGYGPMRFFCKPGESRDIVILDNDPNQVPEFFEHEIWDGAKKRKHYETCAQEFAHCPLCEVEEKPAYWVRLYTIIDLTPYTNKDGKEFQFSKKLLAVKGRNQAKFDRLIERRGNRLRGLHLVMDRVDKKSFTTGEPEFIEFIDEKQIKAEFTVEEKKDENGKVVLPSNHFLVPYNYAEVIKAPDEKRLYKLYGGTPPAGSEADAEVWPEDDGDPGAADETAQDECDDGDLPF